MMIKGHDIICLSWLDWDGLPLVMHQMMTRLAQKNRVLYVNPVNAWLTYLFHPSFRAHLDSRRKHHALGTRENAPNLYVYTPAFVPLQYGHLACGDALNQQLVAREIRSRALKLGMRRPLLWVYDPFMLLPRGQFNEEAVIYDCNDDIVALQPKWRRRNLARLWERFVRQCDMVFVTSKNLYEMIVRFNPNVHYFPSGIDEAFCAAEAQDSTPRPADMRDIPPPVIGFVGALVNIRMAWDWILDAAKARPDWSFLFIGPRTDQPPAEITAQHNIYFLGRKEQEELIAYIRHMDLTIIPYQNEGFLRSCFPTKAFEYAALGKPVVSSMIPALKDYPSLFTVVDGPKGFQKAIAAKLNELPDQNTIRARIGIARQFTWSERVEKTSALINALLSRGA
jgi:glycosyltransferase involved in cell wall biosynthesis